MLKPKNIASIVSDEVPEIVYVADIETYRIYYMNKAAQEKFGHPTEKDLKEKKCYEILQNRNSPCPFCTNHILKKDEFYTWEHYNPSINRYFILKDKLVEFNGKQLRVERAEDITERVLLEQKIKNQILEQNVLYNCIEILHHSKDMDTSIMALLKEVGEYYEADRACIFDILGENKYIQNTYEWCREGVNSQKDRLQKIPFEVVERWFDIFDVKGEFFIEHVKKLDKESEEYKLLTKQDIYSIVTAPLRNEKDKYVGFISVDNSRIRITETHVLRSVSAFVTSFMAKSFLVKELYRLSFYDELTGIRNRHSYGDKISQFELGKEKLSSIGIIYIDINGLKKVNDTLGHKSGDKLIKRMGELLDIHFKEKAYRVGGDEFVVLYENMSENDFNEKVQDFRNVLANEEELKASLGTKWNEDTSAIIKQIEEADELMYKEKQRIKSRVFKS